MSNVVKFENSKPRKLDWKQEADMRKSKRKDAERRGHRAQRHTEWEEE